MGEPTTHPAALGGIALGVPLLAVTVSYLATRSRLPVVRPIAG